MSSFSVIIFYTKVKVFKNGFKKYIYNIDIILDLVFIILRLFLQVINVYKLLININYWSLKNVIASNKINK